MKVYKVFDVRGLEDADWASRGEFLGFFRSEKELDRSLLAKVTGVWFFYYEDEEFWAKSSPSAEQVQY